jgi:hypothetical protein
MGQSLSAPLARARRRPTNKHLRNVEQLIDPAVWLPIPRVVPGTISELISSRYQPSSD